MPKFFALSLLFLTIGVSSAELEKIVTTDNRVLIGYYDENTGVITLDGKIGGSVTVPKSQIASRNPYIKAISGDPLDRLKDEERAVNAQRERALSDADKFRELAKRQHTTAEEALALANAQGAMDEATRLAKLGGELRKKILEMEASRQKPEPTEKVSSTDAWWKLKAFIEEGENHKKKLNEDARKAIIAYLESLDLTPAKLPVLPSDPRRSEVEAYEQVVRDNEQRRMLAKELNRVKFPEAREFVDYLSLAKDILKK